MTGTKTIEIITVDGFDVTINRSTKRVWCNGIEMGIPTDGENARVYNGLTAVEAVVAEAKREQEANA